MPQLETVRQELQTLVRNKEDPTAWQQWQTLYMNVKHYLSTMDPDALASSQHIMQDLASLFLLAAYKCNKLHSHAHTGYSQLIKLVAQMHVYKQDGVYTSRELHEMEAKLKDIELKSMPSWKPIQVQDQEELDRLSSLIAFATKTHEQAVMQLQELTSLLHEIGSELEPVHDRLVELKHQLEALLKDVSLPSAFSMAELEVIQHELREIDSIRIDGAFVSSKDGHIVQGQATCIHLLELCYEDVHELIALKEEDVSIDHPLRHVYETLLGCKGKLEQLMATSKWWILPGGYEKLEKYLLPIQVELGEMDNQRRDGKFLSPDGSIPPGQAILHFLLHKCYRLVHLLQLKSEQGLPVSKPLAIIYTQLHTLSQCLKELVKWKVELSASELIPYQMRLSSIDNQRVQGQFLDEHGNVPEGQASSRKEIKG